MLRRCKRRKGGRAQVYVTCYVHNSETLPFPNFYLFPHLLPVLPFPPSLPPPLPMTPVLPVNEIPHTSLLTHSYPLLSCLAAPPTPARVIRDINQHQKS